MGSTSPRLFDSLSAHLRVAGEQRFHENNVREICAEYEIVLEAMEVAARLPYGTEGEQYETLIQLRKELEEEFILLFSC